MTNKQLALFSEDNLERKVEAVEEKVIPDVSRFKVFNSDAVLEILNLNRCEHNRLRLEILRQGGARVYTRGNLFSYARRAYPFMMVEDAAQFVKEGIERFVENLYS